MEPKNKTRNRWYEDQLQQDLRFFFNSENMELPALEIGLHNRKRLQVLMEHFETPPPDMEKTKWNCFRRNPLPPHVVESEEIKIKLERCDFNTPPPFQIPSEAFKSPIHCSLFGFDVTGHAYVRFHGNSIEDEHFEMLSMMKEVYSCAHPRLISNFSRKLKIGDLIVAKIRDDEDDNQMEYIRGRILEVNGPSKAVTLVDIDTQNEYTVPTADTFWMFDHFFNSPMMSIKCSLRFLERFKGTTAIPEASLLCSTPSEQYGMIMPDSEDPSIPTIQLYRSCTETVKRDWSYNFELFSAIISFNDSPLILNKDMRLLNARISHVLRNGHVWIQLQSGLMTTISHLKPSEQMGTVHMDNMKQRVQLLIKEGCVRFMIQRRSDQKYYRVNFLAVLDDSNDGEVMVEYTDYGMKEIVYLDELIPFEYFGVEFQDIPPQVFRANLKTTKGKPVSQITEEDLKRLVETEQKQQVSIFKETSEKIPYPIVIVYFLPMVENNDDVDEKKRVVNDFTGKDYAVHRFPPEYPGHSVAGNLPITAFRYSYKEETEGVPHWIFLKSQGAR